MSLDSEKDDEVGQGEKEQFVGSGYGTWKLGHDREKYGGSGLSKVFRYGGKKKVNSYRL